MPHRIAIIGAGLAGLTAARNLQDHGHTVTVLEKSRGAGGRMARRRHDGLHFDHGAQYFTVRDPRFARFIDELTNLGHVAPWQPRLGVYQHRALQPSPSKDVRFVGVPGMNSLACRLAESLDVRFDTLVTDLSPTADSSQWNVRTDGGQAIDPYDAVLVTAPAPQTADLLRGSPFIARAAADVRFAPCWAVMLAFDANVDTPFDGIFVNDSPLSWIARNASKPDRLTSSDTWVLHASPEYSRACLEHQPPAVIDQLVAAFREILSFDSARIVHAIAHRWRFAIPKTPLISPYLVDPDHLLFAAGDWCAGPRVEGAFLSGVAVAESIHDRLMSDGWKRA